MKIVLLVVLAYCIFSAGAIECDSDNIACANKGKCIPLRFICDHDNDCGEDSDEEPDLCSIWRNTECPNNEVMCSRNGDSECLPIKTYCTTEKPRCEGDLDRRICQMLENGVLEKLADIILESTDAELNKSKKLAEKFQLLIPHTLRHDSCPPMYTLVGYQCLSIFHIGSMSWGEAREFCRLLDGDLITFMNSTLFVSAVQHLQDFELTSDFWIGGQLENVTGGWTWIDGTPMEMGTPYWTTRFSSTCVERNVTTADTEDNCYQYYQAPKAEPKGRCVSLSFEHFFYMSEDNCVKKKSPLCIYNGEEVETR